MSITPKLHHPMTPPDMYFLSGEITANYKGRYRDDRYPYLNEGVYNIEELDNVEIRKARIVLDYTPRISNGPKTLTTNLTPFADIYFDPINAGTEKDRREKIQRIYIEDVSISETTKEGNLTYGSITGRIFTTIGEKELAKLVEEKKIINKPQGLIEKGIDKGITTGTKLSRGRWGCLLPLLLPILILLLLPFLPDFKCNNPVPAPIPPVTDSTSNNVKDSIIVKNKTVNLSIYDWNVEDGDIIDLTVNGQKLVEKLEIRKVPKTLMLDLRDGENVFDLKCISQGRRGYTTATFEVNDGNRVQTFTVNGRQYDTRRFKMIVRP